MLDHVPGEPVHGYALAFDKPNLKDKREGLPNLRELDGSEAFGVVFDIPAKQLDMLDGFAKTGAEPRNAPFWFDCFDADALGAAEVLLPALQPIQQKKLFDACKPGSGSEKMAKAIEELKKQDHQFHMDGGSWTNDISWVHGYDDVLSAMERSSATFHERVLKRHEPTDERRYRNALYHLLSSQTSCYRYWGQGLWTDYGRELCRRTEAILAHDYA